MRRLSLDRILRRHPGRCPKCGSKLTVWDDGDTSCESCWLAECRHELLTEAWLCGDLERLNNWPKEDTMEQ